VNAQKRCSKCGESKEFTSYRPHVNCAGGRRPDCPDCENAAMRKRRAMAKAPKPQPMDDEQTAPGTPPPLLSDPKKPDVDAYLEAPRVMPFANRLVAIGDMHMPRHHPDALEFLAAIKSEFDPDCNLSVGDEADFHGLSFHERDPDLTGPSEELRATRAWIAKLQELFPKLWIIESNHGSRLYRKALAHGIPQEMVKSYNDVLQVGAGWSWLYTMTINTKTGPIHVEHGQKMTARTMSRRLGMSVIQGHRHGESFAEWWNNSLRPMFAMQTGCLIDNRDRGFWYNRNYREHPIISSGVVLEGEPFVIRLGEAKSGRWDRRIVLSKSAAA